MSMNLRPLQESDLEAALAIWNRSAHFDQMTPELLDEKISEDPDYDPELVLLAEQERRPVGLIMGVQRHLVREGLGFIKLLAVDPSVRRRGVGKALLHAIEQTLRAAGVQTIRVFDSNPNYLVPGIDPRYTETLAFFERQGYERFGDTANMEVDLSARSFETKNEEERLRAAGFEIRRALMADWDDVMALLARHWPAWIPEVERALSNYPISLHLALHQKKVAAFSAHDGNNQNTGWFGPMGTDPDYRGKNLGGVLLLRCLADIKAQGHRRAIIPWVGPYAFYLHYADAHITRVFWRYRKKL
ncbi:GNAT family N-acetyltransferase [candidate division KSB1 bacterium]|nr:GNAT family N-acetyltransferase [bacterium]NUM65225.1 GNAT family N-acetyltransferase [candidate division KSB1 bacterium]